MTISRTAARAVGATCRAGATLIATGLAVAAVSLSGSAFGQAYFAPRCTAKCEQEVNKALGGREVPEDARTALRQLYVLKADMFSLNVTLDIERFMGRFFVWADSRYLDGSGIGEAISNSVSQQADLYLEGILLGRMAAFIRDYPNPAQFLPSLRRETFRRGGILDGAPPLVRARINELFEEIAADQAISRDEAIAKLTRVEAEILQDVSKLGSRQDRTDDRLKLEQVRLTELKTKLERFTAANARQADLNEKIARARDVQDTANYLSESFGRESSFGRLMGHVAAGAQLATYAVRVNYGDSTAAAPLMAGSVAFLKGLASGSRGGSEMRKLSRHIRDLVQSLGNEMRRLHELEFTAIARVDERLKQLSAKHDRNLKAELEACAEVLYESRLSGSDKSLLLQLGYPTMAEILSTQAKKRLQDCQIGLRRHFGAYDVGAPFILDKNALERMAALDSQQVMADVLEKALKPTLSFAETVLSDRGLELLTIASWDADSLRNKLRADAATLKLTKLSSVQRNQVLKEFIDTNAVVRYGGYAWALYWTIEALPDGVRASNNDLGRDSKTALGVLRSLERVLTTSNAQQRVLAGDILCPIIWALIFRDHAALADLRAQKIINAKIPVKPGNPKEVTVFERYRSDAIKVIETNPVLRRNLVAMASANLSPGISPGLIHAAAPFRSSLYFPKSIQDAFHPHWRIDESGNGGWWIDLPNVHVELKDLSAFATGEFIALPHLRYQEWLLELVKIDLAANERLPTLSREQWQQFVDLTRRGLSVF